MLGAGDFVISRWTIVLKELILDAGLRSKPKIMIQFSVRNAQSTEINWSSVLKDEHDNQSDQRKERNLHRPKHIC